MKTARVKDTSGAIRTVHAFAEFSHTVQGQSFDFVICHDVSGIGVSVTLKSSGSKVCTLPDAIKDKPNATLLERAMDCLTRLIDRVGEARARSVFASQAALPSQKFVATWNVPGCLPEMEPAEFETFNEARDFVIREIERDMLDLEEAGDYEQEIRRINRALEWIRAQSEPFSVSPINGYSYEVSKQS